MNYSKLEFSINPKFYIEDDENQYEIPFKMNKYVDNKLLQKILKDMLSPKFKKHLYACIFDTGSNDKNDISQYLDGKMLSVVYNKPKNNFMVETSLFMRKQLPKKYSSLSKTELLEAKKVNKLVTKKKIKEMVAENINHFYRASGHFKDYKKGEVDISINLDSDNKKFVTNFKIN
jgi:hypothetical protein